ncbi:MAG: glycosyltransferase [bacterium]|nr:glycosyltransferase [bacterium]
MVGACCDLPPFVSVVIPVFDRPSEIERAVESVIAQSYRDFELLIIDDGSSLPNKCYADWMRQGITIVRTSRRGVSAARNLGVKLARGRWLAFLDSDDSWSARKLERQVTYIQANPLIKVLQSQEQWIRHGRRVNQAKHHQMLQGNIFNKALEMCCISPSSVIIEKELFFRHGGFDESMRVCEDYDLWLRIAVAHEVGLVESDDVVKYGGHADQLSRSVTAIDRFRVYSLLKLLYQPHLVLSTEQRRSVCDVLRKKANIVSQGAAKRGLVEDEQLFTEVYNKVIGFVVQDYSENSELVELFTRVYDSIVLDLPT